MRTGFGTTTLALFRKFVHSLRRWIMIDLGWIIIILVLLWCLGRRFCMEIKDFFRRQPTRTTLEVSKPDFFHFLSKLEYFSFSHVNAEK